MSPKFTPATSRITLAGALILPALVLALSGCTGSSPSQVLHSEGSSTSGPAGSGSNTVVTLSLRFMPSTITVHVGDTVTWTNGEEIMHTVTSGAFNNVNPSTGLRSSQTPDGMFDTTLAPKGQPGDTFSHTYTTAGTYQYYCGIHLTMNAMVVVLP